MKKVLLLLFVLALPSLVSAAEVNGIRVTTNQKDNAGKAIIYEFLFTSEPKLTYQNVYSNGEVTGQEVIITGKDVKGRFGQDELILSQGTFESVTFVTVDPSGLKTVPADNNVIVRMTGSHGMEICGLADGEAVSVFTLDGKQIVSTKALANGNAFVALPGSEAGTVYIVKTGEVSFKVRTNK
jgi:hypothetical protein